MNHLATFNCKFRKKSPKACKSEAGRRRECKEQRKLLRQIFIQLIPHMAVIYNCEATRRVCKLVEDRRRGGKNIKSYRSANTYRREKGSKVRFLAFDAFCLPAFARQIANIWCLMCLSVYWYWLEELSSHDLCMAEGVCWIMLAVLLRFFTPLHPLSLRTQ